MFQLIHVGANGARVHNRRPHRETFIGIVMTEDEDEALLGVTTSSMTNLNLLSAKKTN